MRKFSNAIAAVAAASLTLAAANAATYQWSFDPNVGSVNHAGGTILSVTTTYNDATDELSWYATFGAVPGQPLLRTDGFTLAISPGPNPKNHPGEMALFYFDAVGPTPIMSVYGYNAMNNQTSFNDGSNAGGTQAPDRIFTSQDDPTNVISDIRAIDNGDGTRTLGFTMDATNIIDHLPLHPDAQDPWTGASYGDHIGIWFHQQAGTTRSYNSNGYLTSWGSRKQGWLDRNMETTVLVPEPASIGLMVGGLIVGAIRRRNAR
ncbi:MAG: PEP-CTERM sorting domain-containing protein [Phycisphaerae bacterium]